MRLIIESTNDKFLNRLKKEVFKKLDEKERQRFEILGVRNEKGQLRIKDTPTAVAVSNKFQIYDPDRQESVSCYWIKGQNVGDANSLRDRITKLDKFYFTRAETLGKEFIGGQAINSELRKLLLIHPQNQDNIGKFFHIPPKNKEYRFKEYNREKIATNKIDLIENQTKARTKVSEMTDQDILRSAAGLFPTKWESMSPRAMKLSLYELADKDPMRILKTTKGTLDHAKSITERAKKHGVISKEKNTMKWSDGEKIVSFSTAAGAVEDQFADFLMGNPETLDRIEKELATKE